LTVNGESDEAHCRYTGAANVEPAPEIVPDTELEGVALDGVDVDDFELLPHAARPSASTTVPTSAPVLFLITASPLAGLLV
jgi:hypothetical protein